MAADRPETGYSIVQRARLDAALEGTTYAPTTSAGLTFYTMPIYDVEASSIQAEFGNLELNRAKNSLGPDTTTPLQGFTRIRCKTYVYGTGTTATPPYWASQMLPLAGFKQAAIVGTGPTATITGDVSVDGALTGNFAYKYTKIDLESGTADALDLNESLPSSEVYDPAAVTAKKISLTFSAAPGAGYGYRIYRIKNGGSTYYWVGDLLGTDTVFTDNTPDAELADTHILLETATAATGGSILWYPINEDFYSGWFMTYLDSHLREAKGVRGGFTLSAQAGNPMELMWDFQGLYTAATMNTANPASLAANPGQPPRFVSAALTINPRKYTVSSPTGTTFGTAISPVVKRVSWTSGAQVGQLTDAQQADAVTELAINQRFQSRLNIVFAVNKSATYDPVEEMKGGVQYAIKFKIGAAENLRRFEFAFPAAQHARAPQIVDVENTRCWDCEYILSDYVGDNSWARIRQY